MRSRQSNPELQDLIRILRKESRLSRSSIWLALAEYLEKPGRLRSAVNLSRLERNVGDKDVIAVPGSVLGAGNIRHKVTVAAYKFSTQAKMKIEKAGGRCISFRELIKIDPKGRNVKLIG